MQYKTNEDKVIEIGGERVIVNKLFGPTVFMDIRITPDVKSCCWIIDRLTILPCPDPDSPHDTPQWQKWVEWCRIPAQFEWEFREC